MEWYGDGVLYEKSDTTALASRTLTKSATRDPDSDELNMRIGEQTPETRF